jgi:2-keto-3-deoxy-L-rhamnonate aldolase RhmA
VIAACQRHGKAAGILSRPELMDSHLQLGFRFVALGSDAGAVVAGLTNSLKAMRKQH